MRIQLLRFSQLVQPGTSKFLIFQFFSLRREAFFSMTGMSQIRGENPQEAPSAGELHSDLQVSNREVWERRSNSESVA